MTPKQKQDKVNSIDQLIPIVHAFEDFQNDALDERAILKDEIQKECDHVFTIHGDLEVCLKCNLRRLT